MTPAKLLAAITLTLLGLWALDRTHAATTCPGCYGCEGGDD